MNIKRIILTPVSVEQIDGRPTLVRDRPLATVQSTRLDVTVMVDGYPLAVRVELEHD